MGTRHCININLTVSQRHDAESKMIQCWFNFNVFWTYCSLDTKFQCCSGNVIIDERGVALYYWTHNVDSTLQLFNVGRIKYLWPVQLFKLSLTVLTSTKWHLIIGGQFTDTNCWVSNSKTGKINLLFQSTNTELVFRKQKIKDK